MKEVVGWVGGKQKVGSWTRRRHKRRKAKEEEGRGGPRAASLPCRYTHEKVQALEEREWRKIKWFLKKHF